MDYNTISTPLGDVHACVMDGDQIYVSTEAEPGKVGYLVVRGVGYRVSTHMFRWLDGRFHIGQEDKQPYERRMMTFITRSTLEKHDVVSSSARDTLVATIETAVRTWADANPKLFDAARLRVAEELLAQYERDHQKLMEQLDAVSQTIANQKAYVAVLRGEKVKQFKKIENV